MLKIYNAYANHGEIKLEDYITFNHGAFDTGCDGFGEVRSGNLNCEKANYELRLLNSFREYIKNVKIIDGRLQNFIFFNPVSYESLAEEYKNIAKTSEAYAENGLNEEGILLFTNYINLSSSNDGLTETIFGRDSHTGLYLLMPNASVSMKIDSYPDEKAENYEVLQSQNLGKKLAFTKMNRKI